jgi:hypothetical protein
LKWIKLDCDYPDDPKIERLCDELGFDVAMSFWPLLLAIVGRYGAGKCALNITESGDWTWDLLAKRFKCRTSVLLRRLEVAATLRLISEVALKENVIAIPNMMKRCDDYTRKTHKKSGQSSDSVRTQSVQSTDKVKTNVHVEQKRTEENRRDLGETKVSPTGATPESPPRERDEAADLFADAYLTKYGLPYTPKKADFVHLSKLRTSLKVEARASPPDWPQTLGNYFATPQDEHTLADVATRFATFRKYALDRFKKPIEPQPEQQNRLHWTKAAQ